MSNARVTVVRPYDESIRKPVFAAIRAAGFVLDEADVIPPKTADAKVLDLLRTKARDVLLVPFHGHMDDSGSLTNGLKLLAKLEKAIPDVCNKPVLMPVASGSYETVRSMLEPGGGSGWISEELKARILLLSERDLVLPLLPARIRAHAERIMSADAP